MDQFNRRGGRRFGLLLALALAALAPASYATLPPAVDGQPLPSLAPMLQKVTPAVVNISTKTRVQVNNPYFDDPVFRRFFGLPSQPMERVEQSLGSGVIVDAAKGYVLTNNHVVGGADDIKVTLQDGRNFTAKLLGADPDTDVAVLQINAGGLSALPLADSTKLRVGDFVVAVGDPFGLGQTVTSGIVSALGRSGLGGTGYQNFIQTDASINPGNSGGALVNLRGELVGINSMIFSPSGASAGIGFAIPSNLSAQVMRQLVVSGKVLRGSLGVETQDIDARIAQALKLPDSNGIVVTRVAAGSPAAVAGLAVGDVITALDGKPVRSAQELLNAQGLLPVDSAVSLSVFRNGASRTVNAKLSAEKIDSANGGSLDPRLAGIGFSDLTREQRSRGIYGVQVAQVQAGSRAARAGLQRGDIVIAVGNLRIANLAALKQLAGVRPRQLVLVVASEEGVRYVVVN
jgi:serine protease Do/serine protease DegQ